MSLFFLLDHIKDESSEPLLQENEREAITDLLQYLESMK